MSLFKKLKQIEKKFAWSFSGFILAAILGVVTLYTYLRDSHPTLNYEILTNTSVLDVKEELKNLEIIYDGLDIRKNHQTLSVINIKVANDSTVNILKGFYDENDPLGLDVSEGQIIKPELLTASNEYLLKNLKFNQPTNAALTFSRVIFDASEFFIVKLLVLHQDNSIPQIIPMGKIAGFREIKVTKPYKEQGQEGFWLRTFRGGFLIQVMRVFAYFLAGVTLIFLVVWPADTISEKIEDNKLKGIIKDFKNTTKLSLDESDEYIFTLFTIQRAKGLLELNDFISKPQNIKLACSEFDRKKDKLDKAHYAYDYIFIDPESPPTSAEDIKKYLSVGLIKKTEEGYIADEHLSKTLNHFIKFLKNRALLPPPEDEEGRHIKEIIDRQSSETIENN